MSLPPPPSADPVRLTQYSHGAGCGCKIAPAVLETILKSALGTFPDPRLLVGYGSRDDAAVYDLGNGRALISTTDFFSPIVDDAFDFGRIAATNALSDVYAMGGKPLLAVAILGWPVEKLPPELAARVVEGGRQACHDAGIALAGGHSIDAPEPFFGLAVSGEVPLANIKRNDTAKTGDVLFLTKPLGTGILSTAHKRGTLAHDQLLVMRNSMVRLNDIGSVLGTIPDVHALTDITGFGLLGHLLEVCNGSGLSAVIDYEAVPKFDLCADLVAQGCYPDGALRNWKSQATSVHGASSMERMFMLADPQTSGGLLICVAPNAANHVEALLYEHELCVERIGRLTDRGIDGIVEIR